MDPAAKDTGKHRVASLTWLWVILAGFALLAGIKLQFFAQRPGFEPLRFHPVWILILLAAARFGFWPGLFTAALSTGFYLWTYHGVLYSKQEVLAFFFVAWVLGDIRDRFSRREKKLRDQLDEAQRQIILKDKQLEDSAQLRAALEDRIVGEVATFTALHESAKRLTSLTPELVRRGAMEVLKDNLKVQQGALYEKQLDGFVRAAAVLPAKTPGVSDKVTSAEPMVALLLQRDSVVSVRDLLTSEAESTTYPFLAMAPIHNIKGEVTGFLSIEKIDFLRFSTVTLRLLGLLGDWLSQSFQQIQMVQSSSRQGLFHPELEVLSHASFRVAASRAKRWAASPNATLGPLAAVQITSDLNLPGEAQVKLLATLVVLLQARPLKQEIVFQGRQPNELLAWIPGGSPGALEERLKRCADDFTALALKPFPNSPVLTVRWEILDLADFVEREKIPQDIS
jgi:hypothetical protein